MNSVLEKERSLKAVLRKMGSVLVAYSGGVDSTYLAFMAHKVLNKRSLAVTAVSPSLSPYELESATRVAESLGFRHRTVETGEVGDIRYSANNPLRCYFCKKELYKHLLPLAKDEGLIWVASGTNTDDLGDFRPGFAATRQDKVRSPLLEVRLGKAEIRQLSHKHGLSTWDKPAQACLSSRIPYGTPITIEKLERVGQAEEVLRNLGFHESRVRHHGPVARIEVPSAEMQLLLEETTRVRILQGIKDLGYAFVTIDLAGLRHGSLNELLRYGKPKVTPGQFSDGTE